MFDSSDGSDETARMRMLVWSISARRWDKYQHLRHYEHFDIRKRVSKIIDEKELEEINGIFACLFKNKNAVIKQSYAAWSNALVKDTDFHTFAIHLGCCNYANKY